MNNPQLEQALLKWNKGEISNGEMLNFITMNLDLLFAALDDVRSVILQKETEEAEAGYKTAGML